MNCLRAGCAVVAALVALGASTLQAGPGGRYFVTAVNWAWMNSPGGTESAANDVNDSGVAVGWSRTASGERHAVAWKSLAPQDLGPDGVESTAEGINGRFDVVGVVTTSAGRRPAWWISPSFFQRGCAATGALPALQ